MITDDRGRRIDDCAVNFKLGCVAPDGTIWTGQETRLTVGRCQITAVEGEKAKRFGWKEYAPSFGKYVYVERP